MKNKYQNYLRFYLVQYRFLNDGTPIWGWILQTPIQHEAWLEALDKVNFPLDLFIGQSESIYFATKEAYLDKVIIEEVTRVEARNIQKIFGNSYNWKEPTRLRIQDESN